MLGASAVLFSGASATGWFAGAAADGFAEESSGPPGASDGFPGSAVGDGAAGAGVVLSGGVSGRETGKRTRCELPGATSPGLRMVGGAFAELFSPLAGLLSPMAISWVSSGSR